MAADVYYPDFKNALLNFIYFRRIFEPAHWSAK